MIVASFAFEELLAVIFTRKSSAFVLIISVAQGAYSATDTASPEPQGNFAIPAVGAEPAVVDGGFDLADAAFSGNPAAELSTGWPADLVAAPIPGYSPQLGWTLKAVGGYFLDSPSAESDVPPSILGVFGMIAENGSFGYGIGTYLHLLDDRLRIKAGAGFADLRYRYYGIGNDAGDSGLSLEIKQTAPLFYGSAMIRVWSKLYLGLGYLRGEVENGFGVTLPDPPPIPRPWPFVLPTYVLDMGAVTIPLQFDTRDHEQFPRSGWLVDGTASFFSESAGSDFSGETVSISVNRYLPMRERDVLALRAYARAASDDVPFFLLSTFGGSKDLRGYPAGRYRDRMMYAVQAEYRWQIKDRWVLTGFAGFGEVAESFGEFGGDYLPAVGVGARFVLSEKHRVGLAVDIASGNDGTEVYLGVGEAF